jgi:hypothetical protein
MKNVMKYLIAFLALAVTACQNQEWEFPDFDYQTVYFAHQYPVRTITLGRDIFDTSLDNNWQFQVMATTGGVYRNRRDITIGVTVDNSLVNNMAFNGSNNPILPLPPNYYSLESSEIVIPEGSLVGGVKVQLTEAFFADPMAQRNTYVLPMRMTSLQNADSILSGVPFFEGGRRTVPSDWAVQPKDFVLYAVKYINEWHGFYLRRGVDVITGAHNATRVRRAEFVERDEVNLLTTHSLRELAFPVVVQADGNTMRFDLLLTFDNAGNCAISTESDQYTVTGNGRFVIDGEKRSWGDRDRDALYLQYQINGSGMQIQTTDTLVMRNRGVAMELFTPVAQ